MKTLTLEQYLNFKFDVATSQSGQLAVDRSVLGELILRSEVLEDRINAEFIPFNLNYHIAARLTPDGAEVLEKSTERDTHPLGDGWYKMQLHQFIMLFGEDIKTNCFTETKLIVDFNLRVFPQ